MCLSWISADVDYKTMQTSRVGRWREVTTNAATARTNLPALKLTTVVKNKMVRTSYSEITTTPEPLWTFTEIEKFWKVIECYLKDLLTKLPLPASNLDFTYLDAESFYDYRNCVKCLHDGLWNGRYSEAVANFKAVKDFFEEGVQLEEQQQHCKSWSSNELQALKSIFFLGSAFSNANNGR